MRATNKDWTAKMTQPLTRSQSGSKPGLGFAESFIFRRRAKIGLETNFKNNLITLLQIYPEFPIRFLDKTSVDLTIERQFVQRRELDEKFEDSASESHFPLAYMPMPRMPC